MLALDVQPFSGREGAVVWLFDLAVGKKVLIFQNNQSQRRIASA